MAQAVVDEVAEGLLQQRDLPQGEDRAPWQGVLQVHAALGREEPMAGDDPLGEAGQVDGVPPQGRTVLEP